jgi:hypothetical protein
VPLGAHLEAGMDPADITTLVGDRLVRELLSGLALHRRGGRRPAGYVATPER